MQLPNSVTAIRIKQDFKISLKGIKKKRYVIELPENIIVRLSFLAL
jgi:hypothetical protein